MTDFDFCPRLRDMLQTGRSELPEGGFLDFGVATTPNNVRILRQCILTEQPSATLEIGLAVGVSALALLATMAELHEAHFHHTAIDLYQSSIWKSSGRYNIESEGMAENFTLHEYDSALVLPELCKQGKKFDLIYVDGSHLFEDVFVDFFYCSRLLSKGGLILFDDCTDRSVRKAVRFIDRNYAHILQRHDVHSAHPHSIKSRAGKMLGFQQLTAYRKVGEPPRLPKHGFTNF